MILFLKKTEYNIWQMLHMWMDRHPSEQNCPYVSNLILTVCQKQTHLKLLCSADKPCHWMSSHLTHFLSAKDLCAGWRNIASEYTMDRIHNGQLIPTLSKGRKKKRQITPMKRWSYNEIPWCMEEIAEKLKLEAQIWNKIWVISGKLRQHGHTPLPQITFPQKRQIKLSHTMFVL